MDVAKLITMRFDKNLGTADRLFRTISGIVVASAGWWMNLATWQATAMTVLGAMWMASGLLSRCSIYYMLGYSTCPLSGAQLRRPNVS